MGSAHSPRTTATEQPCSPAAVGAASFRRRGCLVGDDQLGRFNVSGLALKDHGPRPVLSTAAFRRVLPPDRPGLTHAIINPTSPSPSWSTVNTLNSKTRHHSGSVQPLLTSLPKDAELVTFWVCQYNPRLITLANINTLCAMSHQTSHLGVLVIRPEVEMQSALSLLALIKPDEVQPRQAIQLRADLELLSRRVDHNPQASAHHCPKATGSAE